MCFWGKKETRKVWRDKNGNITCPGDSCPKNCDDSCPIYLNTEAVMLIQAGHGQKAIAIYNKALKIEPDFYDAWNNLGGIYGQIGNFKKAYDCYKKARKLNKVKPNPVYGLMLTSRDLGKYEECLSWCGTYEMLSQDGREIPIRDEVNIKLGKDPKTNKTKKHIMSKNKGEFVKCSKNNEYQIFKQNNRYYFVNNTGTGEPIITTPGGVILDTVYYPLAERLLEDFEKYGNQYLSPESLLPWHYTLCENFIKMKHKEVEDILDACFMQKVDWTYNCCDDDTWTNIFGNQTARISEIREWLSKCTHMQMTAACCIGNAYHSINIAFVLASLMENYIGQDRKKQFKLLADLIAKNSTYGPVSTMIKDFNNFDLYYGIHLDEKGSIINNKSFGINDEVGFAITEEMLAGRNDEADEFVFAITEEMLAGRNYYHYTDGVKDDEQPISLNHDLTSVLSEEDEDDDEIDNELANYIPDDCWVKKIRAVDDVNATYYIIAVEVNDGKVTYITVLLDNVSRMGGGMFFIPGMAMPENHFYEEVDINYYEAEALENEIEALKKSRFISKDFSFVGKKLPKEMFENDKYNGDDTQYMICLQSAHRLAYMDLFINTDEEGIIEDFEYSTYQSTGSEYGDMFSRPQCINDNNEEAIDMLLYIIDKYTDEEYASLTK